MLFPTEQLTTESFFSFLMRKHGLSAERHIVTSLDSWLGTFSPFRLVERESGEMREQSDQKTDDTKSLVTHSKGSADTPTLILKGSNHRIPTTMPERLADFFSFNYTIDPMISSWIGLRALSDQVKASSFRRTIGSLTNYFVPTVDLITQTSKINKEVTDLDERIRLKTKVALEHAVVNAKRGYMCNYSRLVIMEKVQTYAECMRASEVAYDSYERHGFDISYETNDTNLKNVEYRGNTCWITVENMGTKR